MPRATKPQSQKDALSINAGMRLAFNVFVLAATRLDPGSTKIFGTLKETFIPITKTSSDPTKDRFGSTFTSHVQKLPTLASPSDNNQSLADTIKNLTSKGLDHKPFDCNFNEKDSHLLAQLGRLPQVISVPVLDWAPFGLSQRFATLYASALWNSVKTFDITDVSLQKLHALLLLYLPALILHDSRRKTNDNSDGPSHRSIVSLRIRQAEAGLWLPLVDDLLQAHIDFQQQTAPKKPTWKTRCSRAVHKSLSGSWSLAFRALQEDNCPAPSQKKPSIKLPRNSFALKSLLKNRTSYSLQPLKPDAHVTNTSRTKSHTPHTTTPTRVPSWLH